MAPRTVDNSNAPRNTPSVGGNRLFSAQTPDVREGLPYVEYRADARSPHPASLSGSPNVAQPVRPVSPLGGASQEQQDSSDRTQPEPAGDEGEDSSGWNYHATVVSPGPAYGGAKWNGGGGALANAYRNSVPAPQTRSAIGAGPKVIKGAIEAVEDL